jgi:hypothetical protein
MNIKILYNIRVFYYGINCRIFVFLILETHVCFILSIRGSQLNWLFSFKSDFRFLILETPVCFINTDSQLNWLFSFKKVKSASVKSSFAK